MAVRCGQSLVATLLLLIGCADNPPAVIENKSVGQILTGMILEYISPPVPKQLIIPLSLYFPDLIGT